MYRYRASLLSLLGNGPVNTFPQQRIDETSELLDACLWIRLCIPLGCYLTTRHRRSRGNNSSFSMRPVSYQKQVGESFFPEVLVINCYRVFLVILFLNDFNSFGNNIWYVRFEVFTAVTMKNAVGSLKIYTAPQFSDTSRWFLARRYFYPEDGGDMILRNICSHKNHTLPHPRIRHSQYLVYFSN
jgi:hypothetical protein